jgi:hypothetical protein
LGYKIEKNKMGRAYSTMRTWRGAYRILVWKYEGKRSLGKPKRIWEDNIKMDFQEVGCESMD